MSRGNPLLAVVLLAATAFTTAVASEPDEDGHAPAHAKHHANGIGVFLGITAGGEASEGGKEEPTGTIAIEYRRQLSRLVGLGAEFEFVGGARRDFVFQIPATFLLGAHAQLIVGAGVERSEGTDTFAGGDEFLGRLGFGYSIELVPGNTIRPEVNVDFVDGETLYVFGASIGWGF